jgi:hypothetical protein
MTLIILYFIVDIFHRYHRNDYGSQTVSILWFYAVLKCDKDTMV